MSPCSGGDIFLLKSYRAGVPSRNVGHPRGRYPSHDHLQPALGALASLASRSITTPFTASTATALIRIFIGFNNTSIIAKSGRLPVFDDEIYAERTPDWEIAHVDLAEKYKMAG